MDGRLSRVPSYVIQPELCVCSAMAFNKNICQRCQKACSTLVVGARVRTGAAPARRVGIHSEYISRGRALSPFVEDGGSRAGGRRGGDRCPRQKRICHFGIGIVVVASAVGGGCTVKQKETDRLHRGGVIGLSYTVHS